MDNNIKNRSSVSTSAEHHDGVSPTPWRVIKAYDDEPARIIDADDDEVAVELIDADAALIVEAVNAVDATLKLQRTLLGWTLERDRIRDLVRRLEDEYEQLEERDTVCNTDRTRRIEALFREALGGDTP